MDQSASPRTELRKAPGSCTSAFLIIGMFSGVINILMLTGAFFMLQVYDRVLPSRYHLCIKSMMT